MSGAGLAGRVPVSAEGGGGSLAQMDRSGEKEYGRRQGAWVPVSSTRIREGVNWAPGPGRRQALLVPPVSEPSMM